MDEKLQMWFNLLLLVIASCWKFTDGPANTVRLEVGFYHPPNNTVLLITAIGNNQTQFSGDPLACATQLTPCCHSIPGRSGHWFYPNGTEVPIEADGYSFYRNRRDSGNGMLGGALLNRLFGAMGPTGIYHCVIPGVNRVNQTLYIGLYTNTNSNGAQLDPIDFTLVSSSAQFVTFSLTCTSTGGPINTMQWEKNGVSLPDSSIYPDLTDPETATYTNTLQVIGMQAGVYTCRATDGGSLSLSQSYTVEAANPPTAVSANLNTNSGPLIITWSPPAAGGAEITHYRIYYNLGCLTLNVIVANTENHYQMGLNGILPEEIMSVSIRAESDLLPSELITVRIGTSTEAVMTTTTEELTMTTTTTTTTMATTTRMGTAKMMTMMTINDGMETTAQTILPTTGTGAVGIVNEGLQARSSNVVPLLIVAILEGVIIAILIVILIVTIVVFLYWRNRVYTKMQQDSQKMNHDLPSLNNQLTECGGTQSTVKLIIEGHKLREVTDV